METDLEKARKKLGRLFEDPDLIISFFGLRKDILNRVCEELRYFRAEFREKGLEALRESAEGKTGKLSKLVKRKGEDFVFLYGIFPGRLPPALSTSPPNLPPRVLEKLKDSEKSISLAQEIDFLDEKQKKELCKMKKPEQYSGETYGKFLEEAAYAIRWLGIERTREVLKRGLHIPTGVVGYLEPPVESPAFRQKLDFLEEAFSKGIHLLDLDYLYTGGKKLKEYWPEPPELIADFSIPLSSAALKEFEKLAGMGLADRVKWGALERKTGLGVKVKKMEPFRTGKELDIKRTGDHVQKVKDLGLDGYTHPPFEVIAFPTNTRGGNRILAVRPKEKLNLSLELVPNALAFARIIERPDALVVENIQAEGVPRLSSSLRRKYANTEDLLYHFIERYAREKGKDRVLVVTPEYHFFETGPHAAYLKNYVNIPRKRGYKLTVDREGLPLHSFEAKSERHHIFWERRLTK